MRNPRLLWLFLLIFSANCIGIDVVLAFGQCQSDQQSLLLQINSSLVFDSESSVKLSQWSQTIDCCSWDGVDCDDTGRVIGLDLSEESISGGIENATGLFSLQYLQRLNFAFNRFNATLLPSGLANLTNLTYLNLSHAGFAGQIPIEISSMTRLATLDLSSLFVLNSSLLKVEKPNLSVLVQNFTALEELYLDGVNLSAQGNEWCQALSSSLPNLKVLSLSSCFLSSPICSSLANLQSLTVIRLAWNNLSSPVPDFLADFSNLTSLDLSYCELNGTFPQKIFQVPKLETLDLSNNEQLHGSLPHFSQNLSLRTLMLSGTNFSGTLPSSIGNLKNLLRIDLAACYFSGQIPISLAGLTQLVYLDLSSNNFTGSVPPFRMSKNLLHLDLSTNFLIGNISSTNWEQLSDLVYLDLGSNFLNGRIPPSLFSHPSLKQLWLANNQFEGHLALSNASSSVLDTLDLSSNRLEGTLSMSVFELKRLHVLLLSSNKFNGTVQLNEIQRLSNLTKIDLSYNNLAVDTRNIDSSSLPKMRTLKLASCKLSTIPDLRNRSKLFYLDLSENQIYGEIPNWIWELGDKSLRNLNLSHNLLVGQYERYNISSLIFVDLHSNFLHGKIPLPPPTVFYLDYSNNFFSSFPANIGDFLSVTVFFSVSNNSLTGVIPESICKATFSQVLDLSNNKLSGGIPTCLIKMSETLGVLDLRRNTLSGNLSDKFPETCHLQTLNLNGNRLEGVVPKSLANCKELEVLDLGNNNINDTFPCWLNNISGLRVLVLRSNSFYGNITCSKNNSSWPSLQIVDLASNKFEGTLPQKCLTKWEAMMVDEDEAQSKLKHLSFEFLGLSNLYYQDKVTITSKGLEMELVKILTLFTSIDLSCNNFHGPIPEKIGLLKSLHILNLSHNALTRTIPSSIGNLRQLESLDLSMNNLSEKIPSQLLNLNFLSFLNLSHNYLVGMIPSGNQFATFSSTSYEGNEGLCGFPLTKSCTSPNKSPPSATATSKEFDWQFIFTGVGFGIGSAAVVAPLMFCNKVNEWYDDGIDKFFMVILPMVGLTYITSHERRVEAEENLEDEITDIDDDEEMETEEVRRQYCVFCSKLTGKRVVHDPKCTCHHPPPMSSSSSSTSSSSSALAI